MKKKIRAIQYGVGPIGASIARLMHEKQAIEIIGAIDTDPAKVGRDLGEIVGATDAPWGVKISARMVPMTRTVVITVMMMEKVFCASCSRC